MTTDNEKLRELFVQISHYSDQQAFAELFRNQYAKLYRFALQFVQKSEVAEEIVNDIFVKLWRYRTHLQTVTNPEGYLFISVKNASLNHLKQYSSYIVAANEEGISELAGGETPQQTLEWRELQFKLNQTVMELPDQCRTIFKLVKEEGVKPQQVARILNISVRTVETQLYRAMKRLRSVLQSIQEKKS